MRRLLMLLAFLLLPAMLGYAEEVMCPEPIGVGLRMQAERVEGTCAAYLFEPEADEDIRAACISATESILRTSGMDVRIEVCLVTQVDFCGAQIEGIRLWVAPMDFGSPEYAALVLQTCAGRYSHYGLAYGYACLLLGEAPEVTLPRQMEVCDLNLLCFDEGFVMAEDACAARSLACAFAADFARKHGELACASLLFRSAEELGAAEVARELGDFLRTLGLSWEPAPLRVAHGGRSYCYSVHLADGEMYVHRDWQDRFWQLNPLVTEHFLREDYAAVRAFVLTNERQMALYRVLMGTEADDGLKIILPGAQPGVSTSCYQPGEVRILLLNVDSLMHEYIHALLKPREGQPLWETEGAARYFSYYYDMYGIALLNEDYNHPADTAQAQYVREYLAEVGRPIDMAADFGEIESVIAWTRSFHSPDASYAAGSAFVHYLVQRCGAEAVIRHVRGLKMLPETRTELVRQWLDWLEAGYGSYTKYNAARPVATPAALPPGKNPVQ